MIVNRSVPAATVIPVLTYEDVGRASAWLCEVFGFRERLRIGGHRAQLVFGDGALIITARPADQAATPTGDAARPPAPPSAARHSVHVRVADVGAHYARARQRGARILHPPTDYPFGERQYTVEDLGGHQWTFSQSIADVDPAAWGGALRELEQA